MNKEESTGLVDTTNENFKCDLIKNGNSTSIKMKNEKLNGASKRPSQKLYVPKHLRNNVNSSTNGTTNGSLNNISNSNGNGNNLDENGLNKTDTISPTKTSNIEFGLEDPSIVGYIGANKLSENKPTSTPTPTPTPTPITTPTKNGIYENLLINNFQTLNLNKSNCQSSTITNANTTNTNSKTLPINEKTQIVQIINEKKIIPIDSIGNNNFESTKENILNNGTGTENDWFDLYDDSGECVDTKLKNQLNNNNTNNKNSINKLTTKDENNKIDYLKFEPIIQTTRQTPSPQPDDEDGGDEYNYIVEIYDFPDTFKNENIFNAIKECMGHQNFDIKWVDDTHCLGVFSNAQEALCALRINHALLKTRSLHHASAESKSRAQRLTNYIRPYKPRPATTSFVASRLIGASLGLDISKEKLRLEKKKLDNARDQKKKDKELKESAWNGKLE